MFGGNARQENEQLKQHLAQLQAHIAQLEYTLNTTGAGDVQRIRDAHVAAAAQYDQYQQWAANERANVDRQLAATRTTIEQTTAQLAELRREVLDTKNAIDLQDAGLYDFPNPAQASIELGDKLAQVRADIKEMVRAKTAVNAATGFTFNGSAAQGRTFISDMSKMMLRAYNAEAENAVLTVKAGNLDAATKRVEKSRDQAQRLGRLIDLRIAPRYHQLRIAELSLAARHLQAKQAAKEAEREERARLREEAKAQKEMEAERKRLEKTLEKERQHYENTVAALRAQGRDDEIADLETKLEEIQHGIEDLDYRAANIRAGYVYVISNLGSFGEKMVKIGMTRRLEPMDRVRELGDASVPFNFDVHTLFFSADAVGVEAELHRRLAAQKVNRVNNRREFFYATPDEVRAQLADLDGSVLEYRVEPDAEQFRESLRIAEAGA